MLKKLREASELKKEISLLKSRMKYLEEQFENLDLEITAIKRKIK